MTNFDIILEEKQGYLLCFPCPRHITFNVTCSVATLIFFAHAKFQHCEHCSYFVIPQKVGPRFNCRGQYIGKVMVRYTDLKP